MPQYIVTVTDDLGNTYDVETEGLPSRIGRIRRKPAPTRRISELLRDEAAACVGIASRASERSRGYPNGLANKEASFGSQDASARAASLESLAARIEGTEADALIAVA